MSKIYYPTYLCPILLALFISLGIGAGGLRASNYSSEIVNHLDKGSDLLSAGNTDSASKEFQYCLKLDPNCTEAHNNLGLCYLHNNLLLQAELEFRQALKGDPWYLPALNNLGSVMYRKHNLEEALSLYTKASQAAHGQDAEIEANLANVLRDQGNLVQAIAHYHQSIDLKSDFAPAYNNLGLAHLRAHQYKEAIEQIKKAIQLKQNYSEAYFNLGITYDQQGNKEQALSAFQESLKWETNPDYAKDTVQHIVALSASQNHLLKGGGFLKQQQYRKAQIEFSQAIAQGDANDATAWNNLGLSLANQHINKLAITNYLKALELNDPKVNATVHYNLGQSYRYLGQLDQAEQCFHKSIQEDPERCELSLNALGMVLKQKGDLSGAIANYQLAISKSSDTLPVVHYNLAISLEKLESSRQAVSEYQTYLKQSPHGLNASRARLRLHRLGIDTL